MAALLRFRLCLAVLSVGVARHDEKAFGIVERGLFEHTLAEHLLHVFQHGLGRACRGGRQFLDGAMLAHADGIAVGFETFGQIEFFDAGIEQRRAACGEQKRRQGERGAARGKGGARHAENARCKKARHHDNRPPACHGDARRARAARFGVERLHGCLLLLARHLFRVFLLRATDAVRCMGKAAPDVFRRYAEGMLDGRLKGAVILGCDGVLHGVTNLVADVVG